MWEILTVIGIALGIGAIVRWKVRDMQRTRERPRDETIRAGDEAEKDGIAAARHAVGKTSWISISGP